MTTDKPQDQKYRTREHLGRLYAELESVTRQRDALLAACKHAERCLLSIMNTSSFRVPVNMEQIRSAIAACGEGEG